MKYEDLDRNGKIEYIWDYYKIPIIAVVIGLIFIFSILNTLLFNREKDVALDITIRGMMMDVSSPTQGAEEILDEDLAKLLEIDSDEYRVLIDFLAIDENLDPNMRMAYEAKFMAKFPAEQIDVLVMHDDYLPRLKEEIPVEVLSGFDSLDDGLKVYVKEDRLIGIRLEAFETLAEAIEENRDKYSVFIYDESGHKDLAKELFEKDIKR